MLDGILALLVAAQTKINQGVTADINAFAASRNWSLLLSVLPLGVAFGAIHALTPGHSKAILASYLAGSRLSILRGLAVAATLSFTHIFSAVLIALLSLPIVSIAFTGAGRAPILEDLSRALLAAIGGWMVLRAWRGSGHSQREGKIVGVMAGLVPCPLTLFAMMLAIGRGVPEAGLVFAGSFMVGVAITLSLVALIAISARGGLATMVQQSGGTLNQFGRATEAAAGAVLVLIALRELLL